ncbi:DUF4129 domain-containing protein [Suttonella ornithocola]|uniref:DUF4129 domain-containing protein n=1 Tax=Suttonella ornithocola TaxID=279832 RepID=A0A380MVY0_9GAMM|nr:DUF4129 domain-containing protein [Suttonella ornithocola]SUO96442.1 Uncharacterised protein [Suttonella ornithocola]
MPLLINPYPREKSEILSLSFALGRTFFLPMWFWSLLSGLPIFLLTLIIYYLTQSFFWAFLTLGLLRFIMERPCVLLFSRLLFGEKTQIKAFFQDYIKSFTRGFFAELTFRQLFPLSRIARNAVFFLEEPEGENKKRRLNYITQQGSLGFGTVFGFHILEACLIFTGIYFLLSFYPNANKAQTFLLLLINYKSFWIILLLLTWLIMTISNVFLVSAGFMTYLNPRMRDEGWSIALNLKALAKRLSLGLIISFFVLQTFSIPSVSAAEQQAQESEKDKAYLTTFVDDPKLSPFKKTKIKATEASENPTSLLNHLKNENLNLKIGEILRIIIIGLCVIVALFGLYLLWRRPRIMRQKTLSTNQNSTNTTIEILAPNALISTDALEKWLSQSPTEAVSQLYRQSLQHSQMAHIEHTDLETEVLNKIRQTTPEHIPFFTALIHAWQNAAYGGTPPTPDILKSLFEQYSKAWKK